MTVRFTKHHGLGNDFLVLLDPAGDAALTPAQVVRLCDRRRGIGADGVLRVVRAGKHPEGVPMAGEAEWFMDYWNADGSLAEMCGNGSRVFARYLVRHGWAEPGTWSLATRAGVKTIRAPETGDITVDMGPPEFLGESYAVVAGQRLSGVKVSMGNPHLVCGVPAGDLDALPLDRAPEHDALAFPYGVNVELTTPVGKDHVRMRVHERGSGETASCGTGACAAAAVTLRDAGAASGTVTVDVPGGRLTVTLDGATSWLAGPAVIVAEGALDPTFLTAI